MVLHLTLRRRRRRPIEVVEVLDGRDLPLPPSARIDLLALPAPRHLPRRPRPEEVAAAWAGRLKVLAAHGNRTARSQLRRLTDARRRGNPGREAQTQYQEAREIVATFEDEQRRTVQRAWTAAEAAGTELEGLKAIAARATAELGPWQVGAEAPADAPRASSRASSREP